MSALAQCIRMVTAALGACAGLRAVRGSPTPHHLDRRSPSGAAVSLRETFGQNAGGVADPRRARCLTERLPIPKLRSVEHYRFSADGAAYFVTFSVVEWLPVFVSDAAFKIVADSLNFCHRHKGLRINAYVVMPTHLHAILFHESFGAKSLETVVTDFRKFTGRQLCDFSERHTPACFSEMFRRAAGSDRDRRFWQATRHPEQVQTEPFWQRKIDYLHENPSRKGLVRRAVDWRFSSASYWQSDGQIANEVMLSALEW